MGPGFLILCLIAGGLIINYFIAREFYKAAVEKGYPQDKYLWLPFFLGLVGYLLVIALPDRKRDYLTGNNTAQGNTRNSTDASSPYNDLPEL